MDYFIDLPFMMIHAILTRMSFTYKPKKRKRAKSHGFKVRMKSAAGRRVLARRRAKGRYKVTV